MQLNAAKIEELLQSDRANPHALEPGRVREIFKKAKELKGLANEEILALLQLSSNTSTGEDLLNELFDCSREIKNTIYGNRLVLFAPLYVSNLCQNECSYCAFRARNKSIRRRALTQDEIRRETEILLEQGHKRVLLVAGEAYPRNGLRYIFDSIETIYKTSTLGPRGAPSSIRRVNVNIAPLSVEEFRELSRCKIGTYQIFQETYHPATYARLHTAGPKANYQNRLETMDRAMEGGIEDVGVGVLFGLHDWRFEILALMEHVRHLERKFGVGPHTISIPRIEPASGSSLSESPPYAVGDEDFKKIIAVLRLAVPYTGMILSTREGAAMRREAFSLGISQISAGSRTNPGGYAELGDVSEDTEAGEQFSLGDHRTLSEVIEDIVDHGFIPSFCTGCYRLGRVGKDFMDLAKPGLIRQNCLPNAILTFAEYLEDYANGEKSAKLKSKGQKMIGEMLKSEIPHPAFREHVQGLLRKIEAGERDLYV